MRIVAAAIGLAFVLAFTRESCAHNLGISRMELEELPSGAVRGRFTFAAREASTALDRDGHVAVDVRSDGESCAAGAVTSSSEGDGVVLEEDFACARAKRSLEAIAYFVTQMSGSHEDVAILQTPEGTHEELLRPDRRAIRVELSRPRRESPRRRNAFAFAAAATAAVALLAFAIRSILRK